MHTDSKKFDTRKLREKILTMAFKGQAVHIGCAFSIVEIFEAKYLTP
jgi:transketolase